jgi:hypothetical protein
MPLTKTQLMFKAINEFNLAMQAATRLQFKGSEKARKKNQERISNASALVEQYKREAKEECEAEERAAAAADPFHAAINVSPDLASKLV